jgi:preprotein translocase subunit SecD
MFWTFLILGLSFPPDGKALMSDEPKTTTSVQIEFHRAEMHPAAGLIETATRTGHKVYMHPIAEVTNHDIRWARAAMDQRREPAVEVFFTKEGADKIRKLTRSQLHKPVVVLVDGKAIDAPTIQSEILDRVLISGRLTKEEVDRIVRGVNGN